MKRRVTFSEFVSTIALGLWQAICYVCRAFDPRNKTRFWRVIWGVLVTCIAAVTAIFIYVFVTDELITKERSEDRLWLSKSVYVYDGEYIKSYKTGKKIVEDLTWFSVPENGDEMAVFASHTKRGYFNWKTGELFLPATYDRAWIFSEGLAAVCNEDSLFFINKQGNELYKELGLSVDDVDYPSDYLFRNGVCKVQNRSGLFGLLRKNGTWAVPMEYSDLSYEEDMELWVASKKDYCALLDKNMREVFGGNFMSISAVDEEHIYVQPRPGVRQRYNLKGELLDACVIDDIRQLMYDTDIVDRVEDSEGEYDEITRSEVATCLCYTISYCEEGLMGKNGKIITPAIYYNITAIGKDLYLCEYDDNNSVILNSRGEKVGE